VIRLRKLPRANGPARASLENFDAIGQWRTTDAGTPINATGVLLDHEG
jgi:hypothetical protein